MTCLIDDLNLMPHGDETIVGERGVTLSGGQKARVALARAIYSDSDVYLLDDPLSAVDVEVGRRIMQDCICGFLKNKAVVLTTHQLSALQFADSIYVLQNGKMSFFGSYEQYTENQVQGINYSELVANHDSSSE